MASPLIEWIQTEESHNVQYNNCDLCHSWLQIQQQEILQQQMIQNLIAYSENNPDLTAKLLSMVKREHPAPDPVQVSGECDKHWSISAANY